jgi:PAS domain S-box-containing protein
MTFLLPVKNQPPVRADGDEVVHAQGDVAGRRAFVRRVGVISWAIRGDNFESPDWFYFTRQDPAEGSGWGWLAAVHPDDRTRFRTTLTGVTPKSGVYETEIRVRRWDQNYRWLLVRGVALAGDSSLAECNGTAIDITDYKRSQDEQRESISRLRRLADSSPVAVAIFDRTMHYLAVNDRWMRDFNLEGNIVGCSHYDVFPEIPQRWKDVHRNALAGVAERLDEDQFVRANGSLVWTKWDVHPWFDDAGQLGGIVIQAEDITHQKQIELRTQDALLQMAKTPVESPEKGDASNQRAVELRIAAVIQRVLPVQYVAIFTMEPTTDRLELGALVGNSLVDEILTYKRASGHRLSAYLRDPAIRQRLQAGQIVPADLTEFFPLAPDHRHADSAIVVPMLSNDQLVGIVGLVAHADTGLQARDLTLALALAATAALVVDRSRLLVDRQENQAQILALDETTRRMDDFISIAAHELRTPLTSIYGNVQFAETLVGRVIQAPSGNGRDPANTLVSVHTSLERTIRQIRRMDRLVGDLLDASRIQADRLEFDLGASDVLVIVREAVEGQRPAWPNRSITLDVPIDLATIPVLVDSDRLAQVVTNYLTNALKYSSMDKPVAVRVCLEGKNVRVEVRDRGPGLSPQQQEHLFERFYRAPGIEIQSGSGVGLGLGLYINRTIIERHGGKVGVDSAPGVGSTFWFTIPIHEMG